VHHFQAPAPYRVSAPPLAAPGFPHQPERAVTSKRLGPSVSLCLCGAPALLCPHHPQPFSAGHGVDRSNLSASLDTCPTKPLAKADGVHRPDLPLPLEVHRAEALAKADPVQSAPFAATTSGPRNRACP
jgi:hypothetical protein